MSNKTVTTAPEKKDSTALFGGEPEVQVPVDDSNDEETLVASGEIDESFAAFDFEDSFNEANDVVEDGDSNESSSDADDEDKQESEQDESFRAAKLIAAIETGEVDSLNSEEKLIANFLNKKQQHADQQIERALEIERGARRKFESASKMRQEPEAKENEPKVADELDLSGLLPQLKDEAPVMAAVLEKIATAINSQKRVVTKSNKQLSDFRTDVERYNQDQKREYLKNEISQSMKSHGLSDDYFSNVVEALSSKWNEDQRYGKPDTPIDAVVKSVKAKYTYDSKKIIQFLNENPEIKKTVEAEITSKQKKVSKTPRIPSGGNSTPEKKKIVGNRSIRRLIDDMLTGVS